MIYVISPYSSPIPELEQQRYEAVFDFVAKLMIELKFAPVAPVQDFFSPIVYCHPIARRLNIKGDLKTWFKFNMNFLRLSEAAYLLMLPGWEDSAGVKIELNICKMLYIPVYKFGPDFEFVQ